MKKIFFPCMAALLLILPGCSSVVQPTVTPVPTFTFTPPPTVTATTTVTPVPTDTPPPPSTNTPDVIAALLPKGQPATEWSDIPIMPGAIAGDGDAGSYRFTIQASLEDIQNYYEKELPRLGWNFLATGERDSGAAILIFTGNGGTLSVSIIPDGDQFIVMFVK